MEPEPRRTVRPLRTLSGATLAGAFAAASGVSSAPPNTSTYELTGRYQRCQCVTSATSRRGAGRKSSPTVWATGTSATCVTSG